MSSVAYHYDDEYQPRRARDRADERRRAASCRNSKVRLGQRGGAYTAHRKIIDPGCIECGAVPKLVLATEAFPNLRGIEDEVAFLCECGARVRCHKGTSRPMGHAANRRTADARRRAHTMFDELWQRGPYARFAEGRSKAYKWLASEMSIRPDDCHFGLMNLPQCEWAIELCAARLELVAA